MVHDVWVKISRVGSSKESKTPTATPTPTAALGVAVIGTMMGDEIWRFMRNKIFEMDRC